MRAGAAIPAANVMEPINARELAQWVDALAFDGEFAEDGPDEIARKVAQLRSSGRFDEMNWWMEVAAKLVRLYEIRADGEQ